jgi:hypothetical protein
MNGENDPSSLPFLIGLRTLEPHGIASGRVAQILDRERGQFEAPVRLLFSQPELGGRIVSEQGSFADVLAHGRKRAMPGLLHDG